MLIEIDKYQPNSLRKGRVDALEKDISDGYTLFDNKFNDPRIITINDFINYWTASQLRFLVYVHLNSSRFAVRTKIKISISKLSTKFSLVTHFLNRLIFSERGRIKENIRYPLSLFLRLLC